MTIFAVLMPSPQPALVHQIQADFPSDHLQITETQWLVSANLTAVDLVAKLGIYNSQHPEKAPTGVAIVFAVSSYYGRASTAIWDWIKAKMESGA